MDWETVHAQLKDLMSSGTLSLKDWPIEPAVVTQLARLQVRLVRGPEALLNNFKQSKVRTEIVRQVAYSYIEKYLSRLDQAKEAEDIRKEFAGSSLAESLRRHVDQRVSRYVYLYPARHSDSLVPYLYLFPVRDGGFRFSALQSSGLQPSGL